MYNTTIYILLFLKIILLFINNSLLFNRDGLFYDLLLLLCFYILFPKFPLS